MKKFLILLIVLFLSFLIQSCTLDVSWTLNFYNQMSSTVYEIYCNESSSSTWGTAAYNGSISSGSYTGISISSPEGSHDIRWEDSTYYYEAYDAFVITKGDVINFYVDDYYWWLGSMARNPVNIIKKNPNNTNFDLQLLKKK